MPSEDAKNDNISYLHGLILFGASLSEPHRMVVFMRPTVCKNLRCVCGNPPTGSVVIRPTVCKNLR